MASKELIFLKGFAKGKGLWNTLKMIDLALKFHEGQTRKTGEPYIDHPIRIASALVSLGITDDITLSGAVGHDIFEDTALTPVQMTSIYGIDAEAVSVIQMLTKTKETTTRYYYDQISDIRAILIKIADRCHNVSTMAGAFTTEKMQAYVEETEAYVFPLCRRAVREHPEYSDAVYTMRYHIESVVKTVKAFLSMLEAKPS